MKIKPNTPFLKVRVVFPNTPRKSRQPQLLTARSSFTNEWRAKSKGRDAREKNHRGKVSSNLWAGHHKQPPRTAGEGRAGAKQLQGRHSLCVNPTRGGLPHEGMATRQPCTRAVTFGPPNHSLLFGEVQRSHLGGVRARAHMPVGDRRGKDQTGPFGPFLQGSEGWV